MNVQILRRRIKAGKEKRRYSRWVRKYMVSGTKARAMRETDLVVGGARARNALTEIGKSKRILRAKVR